MNAPDVRKINRLFAQCTDQFCDAVFGPVVSRIIHQQINFVFGQAENLAQFAVNGAVFKR